MSYAVCTRCGAYHDDGTAELCMDCLDEQFNEASDEASDESFIEELEQGAVC